MTEKQAFLDSENTKMDLALLGYMAQRISVTLYLLDEQIDSALPLRYDAEEAHHSTRGGCWCNLVLFNDTGTKTHIMHAKTHAYAAYKS